MQRKRVRSILVFALSLLLTVLMTVGAALPAAAATENRVTATAPAVADQGSTQYCYIYIDSLEKLSALNVAVHFDPEKVRIDYTYNSTACSLYDSSIAEDAVQYSYIFDGNGPNSKTELFWFSYTVLEDAPTGDSYFDIVVTDAYDAALNSMEIRGSRFAFTIGAQTVDRSCWVYATDTVYTSVQGIFELSYSLSTHEIAAGSVMIQYDPELFEIVGATPGAFLENKSADINTALPGTVYISFAGAQYNFYTDLVKLQFRTRKNVTQTARIQFIASEFYDSALNEVSCPGYTSSVQITHDSSYLADAPAVTVTAHYDPATGRVTAQIRLDKDSHLGAGDFALRFDPQVLTFLQAKKGFSPNFFNINDKDAAEGIVKFSVINLEDITDEVLMLTVTFDAQKFCHTTETELLLSGSGLADSMTNSIALNLVDAVLILPAAPHDYVPTVTPPTCTSQGYTTYQCSRCDAHYVDDYVDMLPHSYGDWVTVTPAKCTETGIDKHVCTACQHEETRITGALGHDHVATVTDPTCTERGYTTHTCTRCGDSYVDSYVDAKGHTPGAEATCTTDQTCTVCGTVLVEALGHNYESVVTDPTCTERGYTTHTCTRCGDSYVDSYVDAKGHTPGTEATCTTDQTCTVCGTVLVEALGHNYESVVTDPTCTEQGYTTHTCTRCGDSYVDSYTDPLGHAAGAAVRENEVPASCGTDGSYDSVVYCTRCGAELSRETILIPATGEHNYAYEKEREDPTCTEDGYIIWSCGCGAEKKETLAKLGHNYESVVTDPTCTEQGYTTHTCTRCDHSYTDSYVDAKGHTPGTEATCTTDQTCTVCGTVLVEALGHNYESVVTDPTCTEQGYTTHTCTRCGDSYMDTYVDALGHDYKSVVMQPTDTERGYTTHTCKRCGHSYVDNYTDPTGPGSITGGSYTVSSGYISKIPAGTTVSDFLKGIPEGNYCRVRQNGTNVAGNAAVATGMKLELVVGGSVRQTLTVVVTGDCNGDGKITMTDMLAVKSQLLGKSTLSGAYAKAGDVSGDGKISATDFIQLKAKLLGKGEITPKTAGKKTVTEGEQYEKADRNYTVTGTESDGNPAAVCISSIDICIPERPWYGPRRRYD